MQEDEHRRVGPGVLPREDRVEPVPTVRAGTRERVGDAGRPVHASDEEATLIVNIMARAVCEGSLQDPRQAAFDDNALVPERFHGAAQAME
jgi:hypothetical protein